MQNLSRIVFGLICVVWRLCIQGRGAKLMHTTNLLHSLRIPGDKIVEAIAGYIGLVTIFFHPQSINRAQGIWAATHWQVEVAAHMAVNITPEWIYATCDSHQFVGTVIEGFCYVRCRLAFLLS